MRSVPHWDTLSKEVVIHAFNKHVSFYKFTFNIRQKNVSVSIFVRGWQLVAKKPLSCRRPIARDHTQVYDTTWEAAAEGSP